MAKSKKVQSRAPTTSRPHMPGYGLPKGTKGLLPWGWAEQRLKKSHNYWITTVRPDGSPHTMIVWGFGSIAPSLIELARFAFSPISEFANDGVNGDDNKLRWAADPLDFEVPPRIWLPQRKRRETP